jgi:hypothetical protein
MTAPERRRPLPALAVIGALSLLTALVWFRVLHRTDTTSSSATKSSCPSSSVSPSAAPPSVLPVPDKVSVLVLNSTQRKGLAGAATKVLKKQGFKTGLPVDDASTYGGHGLIKGVGEIRYGSAALASATLLSYYFPSASLKATDSSTATVMVSLGAKFKKVAAAAEVQRELTKAHVKLSRTPASTPTPTPTGC